MFLLNDKSTIITLQYMIYKQQPQRLGKDNYKWKFFGTRIFYFLWAINCSANLWEWFCPSFFLFSVSSPERLNNCLLDTESTPHRDDLDRLLGGMWGILENHPIEEAMNFTKDNSIYSIITYLLCRAALRRSRRWSSTTTGAQLQWWPGRWGWPLFHGDLDPVVAHHCPLLLSLQLGTVLVHGRGAVGKAANVAALAPADGVMEHSLLVVVNHLLYLGLHELKDWNRGI